MPGSLGPCRSFPGASYPVLAHPLLSWHIVLPAGDKEEQRSPSGGGGRATPRRPRAHQLGICVYVVPPQLGILLAKRMVFDGFRSNYPTLEWEFPLRNGVVAFRVFPQPRLRPPGRTPEPSRQLRMLQNDEVAIFSGEREYSSGFPLCFVFFLRT